MGKREFNRVRQIALALPEVTERVSHGAPCFFIQDRLPLCYYHDNHRGDGRISLWYPAAPGVQDTMIFVDPERFFRPLTNDVGHFRNWVGIFLDLERKVDWNDIASILEAAYRTVAPKKLIAELDK